MWKKLCVSFVLLVGMVQGQECRPCSWEFNPCNPKMGTQSSGPAYYLTADLLYWNAVYPSFSFAYDWSNPVVSMGHIVRVEPSWDFGFRVGMGWNTPQDYWDLLLNYTWYSNEASLAKSSLIGFTPVWPFSSSFAEFADVAAKTHLLMNMGNLEMGRWIYLTRTFAFRPHVGVEGGDIHQKFSDEFTNPFTGTIRALTFAGTDRYWGVGPRLGMQGEWHVGPFSLLGSLAGSLLYGKTIVTSKSDSTLTSGGTIVNHHFHDDPLNHLVPHIQMGAGLQWQGNFWRERMFGKISALWEANAWGEMFNLPVGMDFFYAPFPTIGSRMLAMNGLTVKVEWDF